MSELSAQLAQIDGQIAERTRELRDQVRADELARHRAARAPAAGPGPAEEVSPDLAKHLFILRAGHEEARTLAADAELDAAAASLAVLREKLAEFDRQWPGTLLAVDLTRKIAALDAEIAERAAAAWDDAVRLGDGELVFGAASELPQLSVKSGSPALLARLEPALLAPLVAQTIDLRLDGTRLTWSKRVGPPSLDKLAHNVRALAQAVAGAPRPLDAVIPRRFGAYLVAQLRRTALPKLYPDSADPAPFQAQLLAVLPSLEAESLAPAWSRAGELARFAENLPAIWPEIRQEHYLMQLRRLYQNPLDPEARLELVDWYEDPGVETGADDGWDWNEDEDADEDAGPAAGTGTAVTSAGADPNQPPDGGKLVALWHQYHGEVAEPALFFALYRALVPGAYGRHDLWVYEDTSKFLSHITAAAANAGASVDTAPLVRLCDEHLDRYVRRELDHFENALLPALFRAPAGSPNPGLAPPPSRLGNPAAAASPAKEAVPQILSTVDSLAMAVNAAGGPELRQSVLSIVVERVAVYVVTAVEQRPDIGDAESQQLAIMIAKLDPLAVYFDQVAATVPSWTKLEAVRRLLTGSLASIEEMLDQHQLLDFSPDELAGLVTALFRDSAERARLITRFYRP